MAAKAGNEQSKSWLRSGAGRSLLSVLRTVVSFWRGYIDLHGWAIVFYLVVLVLTGNLLSKAGWVFVAGVILYAALYSLDKLLKKYE